MGVHIHHRSCMSLTGARSSSHCTSTRARAVRKRCGAGVDVDCEEHSKSLACNSSLARASMRAGTVTSSSEGARTPVRRGSSAVLLRGRSRRKALGNAHHMIPATQDFVVLGGAA